ncbi:AraC family transcriptional regulator [Paraglaciecola sp. 2405UD69-4]|uniref:AraC family transcriptional regulator n=1 Tax=Paraglaciecola sp. 2405UD69-4 TaxID=3391836 RepID=UPI0039C9668D
MSKEAIRQLINTKAGNKGLVETGISGVKFFNITESVRCAPAVYEPSVTAIVSGSKEAILDGNKHFYDSDKYICCTLSMPIETGTPTTSPDNPLMGVYICLDTRIMTELAIEMERTIGTSHKTKGNTHPQGITTAKWDEAFTDALYRLISLIESPTDMAILGNTRLRELYYAILKGDSGDSVRKSFGIGNEIARSIEILSSNIHEPITIDKLANQIGMSRAVFHRKFKQATNMSPIQFVKSMRLNHAAMKIVEGTNVYVAATEVGYVSTSQFNREFKRMYGLTPKQWGLTKGRDETRL